MRERTLIKAWYADNAYRHAVVDSHDVAAALAEVRRVDAFAPCFSPTYVRLDIEQWIAGEMGTDVCFTVDADGIRQLEGAA